jgi:integrase
MSQSLPCLYDQFERSNRRINSPQTGALYRLALRQFSAAIGEPQPTVAHLTDDNLVALEKYLRGRSIETINHTTKRIKSLWRWCAQRGLVTTWPTTQRLKAPEPYRRAWSSDEMRQLLAACSRMTGEYHGIPASQWWRVWHLVQWDTGERTGAMLALRWEWFTGIALDIPGDARKGGKHAFYLLSEQTAAELRQFRKPARDLIFPGGCQQTFYNRYTRLLTLAGLPTSRRHKPQRVRRSHLTYWHMAGEDAQARAQHASGDTTAKHYLDETLLPQVDPSTVLPSILTPPGDMGVTSPGGKEVHRG